MNHVEEFVRFKNGNIFEITFNDEGEILKAFICPREFDGKVDVTSFVKDDKYWRSEVSYYLYELKENADESKYFKAYKDA